MKKAKRLLAVILAVIMVAGAACLPVYARIGGVGGTGDYTQYGYDGVQNYYFTTEQGATYVLDLLDEILAEEDIVMYWDEGDDTYDGLGLSGSICELIGLRKGFAGIAGDWKTAHGDKLYLNSIDNAIIELRTALKCLDDKGLVDVASAFNAIGDIGEIRGTYKAIDPELIRGTAPSFSGVSDLDVLMNIINWLYSLKPYLSDIVSGDFDYGLIDNFLDGDIADILGNPSGYLKNMLYGLLVNDSLDAIPAGETVDSGIQKVIDMALITGTDATPDGGANSILGENFEAFLPEIGDEPGGASIDSRTIQVDRNGDGVAESVSMSFYQLVSNALQALLKGMLKDLLRDVLFDALDINPEDNDGLGDPKILNDTTFNLILGAVEGLCVQNGAPKVEYSADGMAYPVPKIDDLLEWFFKPGGGLATLIKIDYSGIHIQDNLMSLLNDVSRAAPGLLGALDIEVPDALLYSSDELNSVHWYKETEDNKRVLCDEKDEAAIDQTFVTYEKDENNKQYVVYATEYKADGDTMVPVSYAYFDTGSPVNVTDSSRADYKNPTFIRPNYYVTTSQAWATLLKVFLNSVIDGCYFPDWADSISSVGAYALASMAATILPEENFIERLDRYHYEVELGQTYTFVNKNLNYDPLPYTLEKADPTGRIGSVVIPKAALDIGASIGAFYLNGVFDFSAKPLTTHYTTLEQFMFEFLFREFTTLIPLLSGEYSTATGHFNGGAYSTALNKMIDAVYSNPKERIYKSNANFDGFYELMNDTLFSLLPSDWLPSQFNGSFAFINNWLCNSIVNFDIQKLISILSVNEGGELSKSVTQVLLNIVARVLAAVFGGEPILPLANKTKIFTTSPTDVSTFDQLLDANNLATLIGNLLEAIHGKMRVLAATVFPLLLSVNFVPKYDTNILGSDKSKYKIADLKDYLDDLDKDVNAERVESISFTKRASADSAAELLGKEVQTVANEDGTSTYIVAMPESFNDEKLAKKASELVPKSHVSNYGTDDAPDYRVYIGTNYIGSVTKSADLEDAHGVYHTYSNFNYASLTGARSASNPTLQYDNNYRLFEAEDFAGGLYAYNNFDDALDDASDFVDDYSSFATSKLTKAYDDWSRYIIDSRLYYAGLYDSNDDGVMVTDQAAANADKTPSIPSSMYPYYTATSVNWSYYDERNQGMIGRNTTVNMNEFSQTNYEIYDMAVKFGNDPENDVILPDNRAEAVVRLALGTINFDITPNASGAYHNGSFGWDEVSEDQDKINAINSFCGSNGYKLVYTVDGYKISRKAFAPITDAMTFGTTAVSMKPVFQTKEKTYEQELQARICKSYDEYVTNMVDMRNDLYNHIDNIGRRLQFAENNRRSAVDVSALRWAKEYTTVAYIDTMSDLRNQKIVGTVNGEFVYSRIYTATTYANFRDAYDFAASVLKAAESGSEGALTQSLVSKAYVGLMQAYTALLAFTGEAKNWPTLDHYIELAQTLVENGNPDNINGYTPETYSALLAQLNYAIDIRENSGYDCEMDDEILSIADDLHTAINDLKFNSKVTLIPAEGTSIKISYFQEGAFPIRVVTNLEEGKGLSTDLLTIRGMYVSPKDNYYYDLDEAAYGAGSGSYLYADKGSVRQLQYWGVLFGDVNGDTRIDGTDKSQIQYYNLTKQSIDKDTAVYLAADVNHDGVVDDVDAKIVENHYSYVNPISQNYAPDPVSAEELV